MEIQEISFENADFAREVFGPGNAYLDTVATMTGVRVESRQRALDLWRRSAHGRSGLPVFRQDRERV